MLKMHAMGTHGLGQDEHAWDASWKTADLKAAIEAVSHSILARYAERYFRPGSLVLEAGCGPGHFLFHFRDRGHRPLGVDFATTTLRRLRDVDPDLPIIKGTVGGLPLRDNSVDAYYSGGVVEHFEEGPHGPLREAWRVLRPDGVALITVPHVNLIRRALYRSGTDRENWEGHVVRHVQDFGHEPPRGDGYRFLEYRMTSREFRRVLESNGFEVMTLQPISILSGEVGYVIHRLRGGRRRPSVTAAPPPAAPRSEAPGATKARLRSLLSMHTENGTNLSPLQRLLARVSGHMVLAVCRPIGKGVEG